jgi:hypothetical protein
MEAHSPQHSGPRRNRRGPHGHAFCIRVAYSLVPVRATRQSFWEELYDMHFYDQAVE